MAFDYNIKIGVQGADAAAAGLKGVGDAAKGASDAAGAAGDRGGAAFTDLAKKAEAAGISTRQYTAALRSVPAQFTDILTQLQGGANPLTVLMQQGGQLKDMFGGVGGAARALGGYVVGLVNPFSLAAAAAGILGVSYYRGAKEAQEFSRTIIMSGGAAGVTTSQLSSLSDQLDGLAGTQAKAAETLNLFVQSGVRGTDNLRDFAAAAIAMERAGGPAVDKVGKAFSDLAKDPVGAVKKLNEENNFLTTSLYSQIKTLQEQGRTTEAASLAQRAYADMLAERAPQMEAQLGLIEKSWRGIKDVIKETGDALLGIGRQDGTEQFLQKAEAALEKARSGGRYRRDNVGDATQELQAYRQGAQYEALSAFYAGEAAKQNKASVAWIDQGNGYLSRQQQLQMDIVRVRNEGIKAGASEVEIQQRIALLQERADPGVNLQKIRNAEGLKLEAVTQAQQKIDLQRATGYLTERGYIEASTANAVRAIDVRIGAAQQELAITRTKQDSEREVSALEGEIAQLSAQRITAQQKGRNDLTVAIYKQKQAIDALVRSTQDETAQDRADMFVRESKAREAMALSIYQYERSLDDEAKSLALESSLIGSNNQVRAVRLEQLRIEQQLRGRLAELDKVTYEGGDAERERERQRLRAAAFRESQLAEQRVVLDEWRRTTDSMYESLTDALMRAFEDGRGYISSLGSWLKQQLGSMIMRPIFQAFSASMLSGPAAATGGLGGATGGAGMASGLGNLVGLAQTGWNMLNGGIGASIANGFGSFAGSSLGASLGLSAPVADTLGYVTNMPTQMGSLLGQGAGMLGNGFAGYGISKALSGGYSAGSWVNTAAGIASAIPGIGPIAGVVGGLVNRAFGLKAKEYTGATTEGSVSAQGFSGANFSNWTQKGGWFRSDKSGRDRSTVEADMQGVLDSGIRALYVSAAQYAAALGLPAESVEKYSASFTVAWGKTDDENKAAIEKAMAGLGNDLAGLYAAQIKPLQRAGEQLADTFKRLGVLEAFSRTLNELGGVFSRIAALGVDAREQLVAMAGGMETLQQQAMGFVQNYYGREEIAGLKARELQSALSAAGITTNVNSRSDFRSLVEGTDISTAQGRQQLATLLGLQGAFTSVADYLGESGLTLDQAAAAAPTTGSFASLFNSSEQVTAINQVSTNVQGVEAAVRELIDVVRSTSDTAGSVFMWQQEVGSQGGA